MAFTLQQSTGAAGTSPSHSQAVGLGIVAAGNALIVVANAVATATIADTLGHTWTSAVVSGRITIWYTIANSSAPITVTITSSQSALISVSLQEWAFGGALSVVSTATGSGTSTTPATGNLTLTATSLVVAGFDVVTSGLTYTPGTGFTSGYTTNSGSSEPFATEYNAAQSITPVAPGFTLSSSSAWVGAAAAFVGISGSQLDRIDGADTSVAVGVFKTTATFATTGGTDTSGLVAVLAAIATASPTEGADTSGLAGDTPFSASMGVTEGADAFDGAGSQAMATLTPTEGHDVLAGAAETSSETTIAATEGHDTTGTTGVFTTSATLGPTGGNDAFAGAADQFQRCSMTPTEGGDVFAGAGYRNSGATFTPTETGDVAAFVGVFESSAVLTGSPTGDDSFSTGSELLYMVYSNSGSGPIDYDTPLTTTGLLTYTTGVLACDATWRFGVRAYDSVSGLEEQNLDCSVTIILDGSCADVTARPLPPTGLRAFAVATVLVP